MRLRFVFLITILVVVTGVKPQSGRAQDNRGTCEQLVRQAISNLGTNCAKLGPNSACYGFNGVTATLFDGLATPADFFNEPGYRADLTTLSTMTSSNMDSAQSLWGIGMMNVQTNNHPAQTDQNALYLLLGEVEITNLVRPESALLPVEAVDATTMGETDVLSAPGHDALVLGTVPAGKVLPVDGISPNGLWLRVLYEDQIGWARRDTLNADDGALPTISQFSRTPMQVFNFKTGQSKPECLLVPPSVLVVQSPKDTPIDITANGTDIRVGSVIFLRTLPDNSMEILTADGEALLNPDTPREITVPAGASVTVPAGGGSTWTNWRLLSGTQWEQFDGLELIARNIWRYVFNIPIILRPSGIGQVEVIVQTDDGAFTPIPPRPYTFPVVDRSTGKPGTDIPLTGWLPFTIGNAACPGWSLYHSDRGGDWDIYRLGSTGSDVSDNISQGWGSFDISPSFAADAQWTAFMSDRDTMGNWEIYAGRTNGSQQVRLTYNTAVDMNPVWGPGNQIVFESNRDGNWELYMVDVSGSGQAVRLTNDPGSDGNAAWALNGTFIVFQSNRDGDNEIYRLDFATGEVTQITHNAIDDRNPAVSHDSRQMAWLQVNSFGVYNLWLMDLATGQAQQLTDTGADIGGHAFAPDNSFLAYHSHADSDYDIFAVDIKTGAIKPLTDNDAEDLAPSFRCGESSVLYYSDIAATEENPDQHDIFQVNPLPWDAPVGLPTILTADALADDVYPQGDPEERLTSLESVITIALEIAGGQ